MDENSVNEVTSPPVQKAGNDSLSLSGCAVWLLGGISVSLFAMLSLVLLVLLIGSLALNAYLGWQLAGLEVTISQKAPLPPQVIVVTPTMNAAIVTPELDLLPEAAPVQSEAVITTMPALTPTPMPAAMQVESQRATVEAIATQTVGGTVPESGAAYMPPTTIPGASPIDPAGAQAPAANPAPFQPAPIPEAEAAAAVAPAPAPEADAAVVAPASAPATSNNKYELIALDGNREDRPAAEHGDLNLKLREPTPIDLEPQLIEIDGSGIDPNTPKFNKVFEPNIVQTYAIHGWDWATNSKSDLIQDGVAVLIGLKTTPGEPVYIPPRDVPIFGDKFFATVLYADEDSLTFLYDRKGSVVQGYTVHLLGLKTDPNLVKLFNESQGNELPGLTLDTPVGTATDELIVAIRDNGTFLDARSKKDWWQ